MESGYLQKRKEQCGEEQGYTLDFSEYTLFISLILKPRKDFA